MSTLWAVQVDRESNRLAVKQIARDLHTIRVLMMWVLVWAPIIGISLWLYIHLLMAAAASGGPV